jgi:hypothetical protein
MSYSLSSGALSAVLPFALCLGSDRRHDGVCTDSIAINIAARSLVKRAFTSGRTGYNVVQQATRTNISRSKAIG